MGDKFLIERVSKVISRQIAKFCRPPVRMKAMFFSAGIAMLAFAIFYYRVAEIEKAPPWLWAGLSALVFFLTWHFFFYMGFIAYVAGQVLLFLGIISYRVLMDEDRP